MSVQTENRNRNIPADKRPIDPRGTRFAAAITALVFAVALVLGPESGLTALLLAIQTLTFAAGAVLGLQAQPYGWLYRKLVLPRLQPPTELEDPAAPRFAQAVGLVFALIAAAGLIVSVPLVFYAAVAMAFAAAFLNAAFNFCLGCEMYLAIKRSTA